MTFSPDFVTETSARCNRHKTTFSAQDTLGEAFNKILDDPSAQLRPRAGEEYDLSLIIGLAFTKGFKTFRAVTNLCLFGFGHDALLLLRSNINLFITIWYILSSDQPIERAKDYLACSHTERLKFLRGFGEERSPRSIQMPEQEVKDRTKRWKDASIASRASGLPAFYYDHGYRFYSSFEHSDAFALNDYAEPLSNGIIKLDSGPSDAHIDLALIHNFQVMLDISRLVCTYFGIDRPDLFASLDKLADELASPDVE
jgi:hypothetical protein